MSRLSLLLLILILSSSACITKKSLNQEKETERIENISFPEDWTGRWQGDLMIYSGLGLQDQLKMELVIQPISGSDNFTFTIVYDTGLELSKRAYELIVVDKEQGLFVVDEKNTIMIESYFMGGKWFQRFEVLGSMLICTIEQVGKNLVWEITSGDSKKISTSGDTNVEGIFEVSTYPFGVYQRAILTKF